MFPEAKTLQEYMDRVKDYAKSVWTGESMPTWLAESPDGLAIYVTPWSSNEDKEQILAALKIRMKAEGVFRYAFLSEVWTVTAAVNEERPVGSLEHVPGRKEGLSVMVEDHTGCLHGIFEIHRDGNKAWLGDFAQSQHVVQSRMAIGLGAEVIH